MTEDEKPTLVATDATVKPWDWPRPVGPLQFQDKEGLFTFSPAPDITPHEVSLLLVLFFNATSGAAYGDLRWREYINQTGLGRHFK